jgi:hypothetical protein
LGQGAQTDVATLSEKPIFSERRVLWFDVTIAKVCDVDGCKSGGRMRPTDNAGIAIRTNRHCSQHWNLERSRKQPEQLEVDKWLFLLSQEPKAKSEEPTPLGRVCRFGLIRGSFNLNSREKSNIAKITRHRRIAHQGEDHQ